MNETGTPPPVDLEVSEFSGFRFNNRSEVEKFDAMLHERTKVWTNGFAVRHISLPLVWDLCLRRSNDGNRIFYAVFDLQLNMALLMADMVGHGATVNGQLAKESPNVKSVLDSQDVFNARLELHRHTTAFIFRYRAIWDKIMGILVLIIAPAKYDKFAEAKSKRAKFERIMKDVGVLEGLADSIKDIVGGFDNKFRTPEAHGSGAVRKFSLSMQSYETTPLIDIMGHWNVINAVVGTFGELLSSVE